MSEQRIRVLCVDDHELLAEGLRTRLELEPDFEWAGHLTNTDHLMRQVQDRNAQLVVLDVALGKDDPFTAAEELARRIPKVRTVFLSAFLRDNYVDAAVRAGAWGFLFKGDSLDVIVDSLRRAAKGEFVLGTSALARCRGGTSISTSHRAMSRSRLSLLSPTELKVLRLIGSGSSRQKISREMSRSAKTIDTHRASIMNKLNIRDRVGLALFAVREGLVEP